MFEIQKTVITPTDLSVIMVVFPSYSLFPSFPVFPSFTVFTVFPVFFLGFLLLSPLTSCSNDVKYFPLYKVPPIASPANNHLNSAATAHAPGSVYLNNFYDRVRNLQDAYCRQRLPDTMGAKEGDHRASAPILIKKKKTVTFADDALPIVTVIGPKPDRHPQLQIIQPINPKLEEIKSVYSQPPINPNQKKRVKGKSRPVSPIRLEAPPIQPLPVEMKPTKDRGFKGIFIGRIVESAGNVPPS